MNFTAIDFETANLNRSSACSLGLVQVRDGIVTGEYEWLIDPQQPFNRMNIAIHGITPSMVDKQPIFRELWTTIEPLLSGEIIIAHNAVFDISVLRYCLDAAEKSYPEIQYLCTYRIGKKLLQELSSHKLNMISNHFGISLNHHNALDDARVCSQIMLNLMEQQKECDPLYFAKSLGFQAGSLYSGGYTPFRKRKINSKQVKKEAE